jgi:GT2 family glycosyltransferase
MTTATESLVLGEDVSIATAAHGNAATTRVCLKSLFQSATGTFELILIDDCSPDTGAIRSLYLEAKRWHANTRIFSFAENLEYSGSVNAVLSHAAGSWVFFVSNDIFITPCYLRTLLEAARENPQLGILRGRSNFVDNGLAAHNVMLPKAVTSMIDLFNVGAEFARSFGHAYEADPFLVGDAFLVTRPVIDRIGTFDPRFFGYFADPDYGLRARIAGFELGLVRGAFAFHKQDANFDYLPEQERAKKANRRRQRVVENWDRFKLKWELPADMSHERFAALPWAQLAETPFDDRRHFCAPTDYTRWLI